MSNILLGLQERVQREYQKNMFCNLLSLHSDFKPFISEEELAYCYKLLFFTKSFSLFFSCSIYSMGKYMSHHVTEGVTMSHHMSFGWEHGIVDVQTIKNVYK